MWFIVFGQRFCYGKCYHFILNNLQFRSLQKIVSLLDKYSEKNFITARNRHIKPLFQLTDLRKYDLIADYRQVMTDIDEELAIEKEMLDFETKRQQAGTTKRKILRSAAQPHIHDL